MREKYYLVICFILFTSLGCFPKPPVSQLQRSAQGIVLETMLMGDLSSDEVNSIVLKLAQDRYELPQNAKFNEKGQIIEGHNGKQVNWRETVNAVMAAKPNEKVSVITEEIAPDISADKLRLAERKGDFTSFISDSSPGRTSNIVLTANLLNNYLILPGEKFSFNSVTGEPTKERGFKSAIVYQDDGTAGDELGGGMCQVSSTLYNAVLKAGLPVVERHSHSKPVYYVPIGQDATTYTDKDFQFVNSSRRRLILKAMVVENYLTVEILAI